MKGNSKVAIRTPHSAIRSLRFAATGGLVIAVCVSAACGKKGPPLAPLVPIPAGVELIEANRLGSDVYVSLTIPATNIDEHKPADIARVEVYAYTGRTQPPRARWVEFASLISTVPVAPPPLKEGEKPDPQRASNGPSNAPLQGSRITVRDTLTPEELVQGKEAPRPAIRDPQSAIRDPQPATGDPQSVVHDPQSAARDPLSAAADPRALELPLKRFYIGVPFNAKGRPGPPGGVAEFPLVPTPDAPPSVQARYTERAIMLAWEPAGGLMGFLLERHLPEEPLPFVEEEADASSTPAPSDPPGPLSYGVYREILPDPMAPPGPSEASWREEPPTPITPLPIPTLDFTDNVEFGRRRCYTVRAVRGIGASARVGDASPPACVTPTDTFAPAPPQALAAVAAEGGISLIWQPNTELDLGGYVVMRGETSGDTLQPLTAAPIAEAGYRDETVKPGGRYVYAVIAVDNRFPLPNLSLESSRVEETAR